MTQQLIPTEKTTFPNLLRPAEVAKALAVSRTQVYRLLASGELPSLHFGGRTVRVRPSDLERFIAGLPRALPRPADRGNEY